MVCIRPTTLSAGCSSALRSHRRRPVRPARVEERRRARRRLHCCPGTVRPRGCGRAARDPRQAAKADAASRAADDRRRYCRRPVECGPGLDFHVAAAARMAGGGAVCRESSGVGHRYRTRGHRVLAAGRARGRDDGPAGGDRTRPRERGGERRRRGGPARGTAGVGRPPAGGARGAVGRRRRRRLPLRRGGTPGPVANAGRGIGRAHRRLPRVQAPRGRARSTVLRRPGKSLRPRGVHGARGRPR
mmetsp:Transcript_19264/g.54982  ORF Transcript_19264/g.54982 Transcript_19264/m.54982 type:complete len:245 (+) Transcript_19264:59-793(+)